MALIYAQRPDATRVAGLRRWNEMGRRVKKGERGIRILAPSLRRERDEDTGEAREVCLEFHPATVFDVAQTEEAELPEAWWAGTPWLAS